MVSAESVKDQLITCTSQGHTVESRSWAWIPAWGAQPRLVPVAGAARVRAPRGLVGRAPWGPQPCPQRTPPRPRPPDWGEACHFCSRVHVLLSPYSGFCFRGPRLLSPDLTLERGGKEAGSDCGGTPTSDPQDLGTPGCQVFPAQAAPSLQLQGARATRASQGIPPGFAPSRDSEPSAP